MLNFVPGPTQASPQTLKAYQSFLGSARLSDTFWADYTDLIHHLHTILQTDNQIAVMTGEGTLALWAGLKSTLEAGDNVLSLVNGIYGEYVADMASQLGAEVTRLSFQDNEFDLGTLVQAAEEIKPKMLTVTHCETPTGLLNPIQDIATIKKDFGIPLLFVDAISSIGATPVNVDANHIDILVGSGPKALSSLSDICFTSISNTAWHTIYKRRYTEGFDALLPFKDIHSSADFPYAPHWAGIKALAAACKQILDEGLSQVFDRHMQCMQHTCDTLSNMGYRLLQTDPKLRSPSVTSCYLPEGYSWHKFNHLMNIHNVQFGRGLGTYADSVFRIGHMGTQANMKHLKKALNILHKVIAI